MNIGVRQTAVGLVAALASVVALAAAGGPAQAAAPPWEPDPNSIGSLSFYDAAGNVVTSGSINDAPFASYVSASAAGRAGDSKATLFGYLPKEGTATGAWSGEALTSSTNYPNSSAPAPLNASALPLVSVAAGDETIATLMNDFPNTAAGAYQGLYQLRVKTSGTGQPPGPTYDSADIVVSGSTWTQVYPEPVVATPAYYTAVPPCRVFDTRNGTGNCSGAASFTAGPVGSTTPLKVKVTGVGGVPSDATAVVLNLTAVGASHSTYVTAWPDGQAKPGVSNLNVSDANPTPNLAIVPVGTGGMIDLANYAGTVHLLGDVSGYFSPTLDSTNTAVSPCRVFDTRSGKGNCAGAASFTAGPVGSTTPLKVKVTGVGGVPDNATAVVLNITAVGATKPTFVTAWPDGQAKPGVSNLNLANSSARPNLAIVPVGSGGMIDLSNFAGTVHLLGDVSGYFAPGSGALYTTVSPCRVFDTRNGTGNCSGAASFTAGPVGSTTPLKVKVTGVGGVPADATAVVVNLTAVGATAGTYITAWPDGQAQPGSSNLNVANANATPNLAVVPVGAGGVIDLYNNAGNVHLLGDVSGYFAP